MKIAPLVLLPLLVTGPIFGQEGQPAPGVEAEELILHAYTLKHQPAREALPLVEPLLSKRGTVELQPGDNTLVIRDTLAALSAIVPVLRRFDHPARPVRVEVILVEANRAPVSGVPPSTLPEALVRRLRSLLPFTFYHVLAQAQLDSREGEEVTYEMGEGYTVSFRLGTLLEDRRLKLHGFRITRQVPGNPVGPQRRQLIHTNLNLWLDQTMNLVLARSEESASALMVVLTCRKGPTVAVVTRE